MYSIVFFGDTISLFRHEDNTFFYLCSWYYQKIFPHFFRVFYVILRVRGVECILISQSASFLWSVTNVFVCLRLVALLADSAQLFPIPLFCLLPSAFTWKKPPDSQRVAQLRSSLICKKCKIRSWDMISSLKFVTNYFFDFWQITVTLDPVL